MADLNRISTPSAPSSTPTGPNVVDIATDKLGQRIGQTTEGVESISATPTGTAASSSQSQGSGSAQASVKKIVTIPESEEELIKAIEDHLEKQIVEVQTEITKLKRMGGRGMAYHITVKVTELRQLQLAIKSLYEMAKAKLLEFYKAVFKLS